MDELISLRGPVDLHEGKLLLRIPLEAGGDKRQAVARAIATVDDEYLNVELPPWLAEKLGISESSIVAIDNGDGKVNITLVDDAGGLT